MLITPYSHEDKFAGIQGVYNCIGVDVAPITIISSNECKLTWDKDLRQLPKNVSNFLDSNDYIRDQRYFDLNAMEPYQAITPWVVIPNDCYASIGPRSTLSKMNCLVNESADIDPGYQGHLFVLLLPLTNLRIEKGVPILSMKLYKVNDEVQTYSGFYACK